MAKTIIVDLSKTEAVNAVLEATTDTWVDDEDPEVIKVIYTSSGYGNLWVAKVRDYKAGRGSKVELRTRSAAALAKGNDLRRAEKAGEVLEQYRATA